MEERGHFDEQLKNRIIGALDGSGVRKVILFGSYATWQVDKDSDIDLLVVTGEGYIPQSFSEKMKIKVRIAKALSNDWSVAWCRTGWSFCCYSIAFAPGDLGLLPAGKPSGDEA